MTRAMIVVDVQNDFCEGGSLAVAGGSDVAMNIANAILTYKGNRWSKLYDYFVATKDFHLPDSDNGGHISDTPDFIDSWPVHCIQGTDGAMFHPSIAVVADYFDAIFYKGEGRPDYSGFQGRTMGAYPERFGHSLYEWLADKDVQAVDIVGLATDHCVRETALDAINYGFKVRIPLPLTAAVNGMDRAMEVVREINAAQNIDTRIN